MEVNEIEMIYVDGSSQIKDVVCNPKLIGSKREGMWPRVILVQRDLLRAVGLDRYLVLCDALCLLDNPAKINFFLCEGSEVMSDPITLGKMMDIQMNHNGSDYGF